MAIAVVYGVLFALGITCPIKYATGISCPGCGMSRATWALLRLDLPAAIHYHPLCFALPPVAVGLIYTRLRRHTRAFRILLWSSVGVMIAVYLYRLLFLAQDVVVADVTNGLIGRAVRAALNLFLE